MAQTQSIYNTPLSGNLGNQTYKNYGGKQVVTTRFRTTSARGDGASRAQRDTRMLMPNLTLIGSQIKEWLPALWENNKFFKRPYTHFISHNMARTLPVLPKELIDQKCCVWGNLQVSCGSLPPIVYAVNSSDTLMTNIKIAQTGYLASVSLGALSQSIIANNPNFSNGDSLVFVRCYYNSVSSSAPLTPLRCFGYVSAITLDVNSRSSLSASWKGSAISLSGGNTTIAGNAITIVNATSYSWAIVHVAKLRGQYLASTQIMTSEFAGMDELADMFSSAYIDYCAASWGYKDKIL